MTLCKEKFGFFGSCLDEDLWFLQEMIKKKKKKRKRASFNLNRIYAIMWTHSLIKSWDLFPVFASMGSLCREKKKKKNKIWPRHTHISPTWYVQQRLRESVKAAPAPEGLQRRHRTQHQLPDASAPAAHASDPLQQEEGRCQVNQVRRRGTNETNSLVSAEDVSSVEDRHRTWSAARIGGNGSERYCRTADLSHDSLAKLL